jgi:hypothetical protein
MEREMIDHLLTWVPWPLPPMVRAVLAIVGAWALPYALRRWLPGVWRKLESWGPDDGTAARVFLSLPSVLAGAMTTAITAGSGDLWRDVWMAALMPCAPLLHHLLKAAPVPYDGAVRDADWKLAKDAAEKLAQWERSLEAGGVDLTGRPKR